MCVLVISSSHNVVFVCELLVVKVLPLQAILVNVRACNRYLADHVVFVCELLVM